MKTWPTETAVLRGASALALAGLIALGAGRDRSAARFRPSRAVTFQTFSLLVIGAYLAAMVAVARWLSFAGDDYARLMGLGFLTLASAVAILILPSRRLRGWLKVTLAKHLFQHRYDYREEWLRFTRTIGNNGSEALPLGEPGRPRQTRSRLSTRQGGRLASCSRPPPPSTPPAAWLN